MCVEVLRLVYSPRVKIVPGNCGCGNPEPGTSCDDGDSNTMNDEVQENCSCAGTLTTSVADSDGASHFFTVQPNPSTGLFQLNNPMQVPAQIEVRDALGRLVIAGRTANSRVSMDGLNDVATGVYHLIVESEGRRELIKIMVLC